MKPYHIQSQFYQAWVDLESIQAVYDVQVLPEVYWTTNTPAMFSIQFAFQDQTKVIQTSKRAGWRGDEPDKRAKERQIILAEIEELKRLHDQLIEAWKQV